MRLFQILEDFIRMIDSVMNKNHNQTRRKGGQYQNVNINQLHCM